eukprot:1158387-Pelagomonas_calceolata.AAC.6
MHAWSYPFERQMKRIDDARSTDVAVVQHVDVRLSKKILRASKAMLAPACLFKLEYACQMSPPRCRHADTAKMHTSTPGHTSMHAYTEVRAWVHSNIQKCARAHQGTPGIYSPNANKHTRAHLLLGRPVRIGVGLLVRVIGPKGRFRCPPYVLLDPQLTLPLSFLLCCLPARLLIHTTC